MHPKESKGGQRVGWNADSLFRTDVSAGRLPFCFETIGGTKVQLVYYFLLCVLTSAQAIWEQVHARNIRFATGVCRGSLQDECNTADSSAAS